MAETSVALTRSSSTRKGTRRRSFQRSTSSIASEVFGRSPLSVKVTRSQGSGSTSEASRTPPGIALTMPRHQLPESRRIAQRTAQRAVLERIARQRRLAEGAQAEAVAVVRELAIAQPSRRRARRRAAATAPGRSPAPA